MSDAGLYISNGTCYYGEGEVADSRYLPCGNIALSGPQSCCFEGDFCLAEGACYDNTTAVTYIAGCTDPTYFDTKCAHKPGYLDQLWVALARCDGDDINLFSGCDHHGDEVEIKHENCKCNASEAILSNPVKGAPTLSQVGLLPTTAGGTISFALTSLPTATGSAPNPGPHGLSTGAKAGIGVGVGVGVPIILATIIVFILARRKKRTQQQPESSDAERRPTELPRNEVSQMPGSPPPTYSPDTQKAQDQWLNYKPELHADSSHKFELPDSMAGQADKGGMNSVQNTPRETYPPSDLVSEYSESHQDAGVPYYISPQSTGSTDVSHAGPRAGHRRTDSSGMQAIREGRYD
ncbi:hypothetical protein GGR57DRAFT_511201 [Xylariaceae sp. FL1272]|nr:hypothetical protein GGR57DRAFT_511201 [Xylariaceae sp. FL1272]